MRASNLRHVAHSEFGEVTSTTRLRGQSLSQRVLSPLPVEYRVGGLLDVAAVGLPHEGGEVCRSRQLRQALRLGQLLLQLLDTHLWGESLYSNYRETFRCAVHLSPGFTS